MPDAHQIVIARRLARNPCVTIDFRVKDGKRTPTVVSLVNWSSFCLKYLSSFPRSLLNHLKLV